MVSAIAVSLIGIGSVLGGYAILTREMSRNYLGTRPASAALEIAEGVAPELVVATSRYPGVAAAEAGEIVGARVKVGEDFLPLLLFVVDDFDARRINTFRHESGAWPPAEGSMLIERTAARVLHATQGDTVIVKTPLGVSHPVAISGIVHDPGLAPAWQEGEGYGYITRQTLRLLGERAELGELRVIFRDQPFHIGAIEAKVTELSKWLTTRGYHVTQARVPPPGRHPHQTQMYGVLYLMLAFSVMALVLSSVLVGTGLSALLARQVREIGIMKTLGGRSSQIAALYAVLISFMGLVAVCIAMPLGVWGAGALAGMSGKMLNLELASMDIPAWVFLIQVAAGVLVPLLVASIPIVRGSRVTVRVAIDQHGAAQPGGRLRIPARLSHRLNRTVLLAVRNAFRRPTRLVLTLALLAAGGAMFMTAINVLRGWEQIVTRVYENRSYDIDVKLNTAASVPDRLRRVSGVQTVEAWGYTQSALSRPDVVDVVRTYPDGSHGSLSIMGPPANTTLVHFPLLAGRWLQPSDTDAVVLNHMVLGQAPTAKVGDWISLSMDGRPTRWKIVGIVEEVGSAGVAYVTDQAFARAAGNQGRTRMLRIKTDARTPPARTEIMRALDLELAAVEASVASIIPLSVLRTAMGDHVLVLIRMLLAMALLMATVGALGLASTMGTNVLERTREIGIMKTLGATPRQTARLVVVEALWIAAMSWILGVLLAMPLTAQVGRTVGMLSFRLRLPFVMDATAMLGWLALIVLIAVTATLLPARRASRLTIREALAHI
ncbi:MAG: FtsX-like permease family protein [Myxococcaceae bacterium]|nr:FtsX-like permease family protein [Myxococcaceae bacterium]